MHMIRVGFAMVACLICVAGMFAADVPVLDLRKCSEAPKIDGDLGDPAWKDAVMVDEFHVMEQDRKEKKHARKKDDLAPLRTRMQREGRTGVYYVLKSAEQGPSFRIVKPKFAVEDPAWRKIAPQRSRYTHLYFYLIDEVLGPSSSSATIRSMPSLNARAILAWHPPLTRRVFSCNHLCRRSALIINSAGKSIRNAF